MNRSPFPFGFYLGLVKLVLTVTAITTVIFIAGLLLEWGGPRVAPLILAGMVGGAILLFLYRDHLIRRN